MEHCIVYVLPVDEYETLANVPKLVTDKGKLD
jgi:hypothetical protein